MRKTKYSLKNKKNRKRIKVSNKIFHIFIIKFSNKYLIREKNLCMTNYNIVRILYIFLYDQSQKRDYKSNLIPRI